MHYTQKHVQMYILTCGTPKSTEQKCTFRSWFQKGWDFENIIWYKQVCIIIYVHRTFKRLKYLKLFILYQYLIGKYSKRLPN